VLYAYTSQLMDLDNSTKGAWTPLENTLRGAWMHEVGGQGRISPFGCALFETHTLTTASVAVEL